VGNDEQLERDVSELSEEHGGKLSHPSKMGEVPAIGYPTRLCPTGSKMAKVEGHSGYTHRGNCYTQRLYGKLHGWWESACLRTIKNVAYLPHGDEPEWCQRVPDAGDQPPDRRLLLHAALRYQRRC
jgi:hypothetical protein